MLWLDYWTSEETLERDAAKYSLPPTMPQRYDDAGRRRRRCRTPSELRTAVENATSRPVSPVYSQISQAVYKNVNKALGGPDEPRGRAQAGPGADREGALQLLMAPVELLIAGGGSRGATFAGWAARHPERARVVAVAEPRADRREALADAHGVPPDAALRATGARRSPRRPGGRRGGRRHAGPRAHRAGDRARRAGLRAADREAAGDRPRRSAWRSPRRSSAPAWSPPSRTCCATRPTRGCVRRLLDEGAVGEVVSVEHLEPVGFWHQAHSYVRGNWRREDEAGPMLLAKCCHDLDWLVARGRAPLRARCPRSAASSQLRPEQRPDGRRRPLPGLRDRAGLPVLGPPDLPRGRPSAARPAGRSTSSPGRRRPSNVEARAARRPVRPLRVGVRQRRRRPPGRLARLRGRRDREPDDDRLHRACATARRASSAPAASCAATATTVEVYDFLTRDDDAPRRSRRRRPDRPRRRRRRRDGRLRRRGRGRRPGARADHAAPHARVAPDRVRGRDLAPRGPDRGAGSRRRGRA